MAALPGRPLVPRGPARWLRPPTYLAGAAETLFFPSTFGAWRAAFAGLVLYLAALSLRLPAERRALARLLPLPDAGKRPIDVDRLLDDLVPRLSLAAENRSWMTESLELGRERWNSRNAESPDPLHRPHYRFSRGGKP